MKQIFAKRGFRLLAVMVLCLVAVVHVARAAEYQMGVDANEYPIKKITLPNVTAWAVVDSPLLVPAAIMSIEYDPAKKEECGFVNNIFNTCTNGHLIKMKDKLILADCGWGKDQATDVYNTGFLYERMVAAGVNPNEITDIIISHMDVDHWPGAAQDGKKLYPNAKVHIARQEIEGFIDQKIKRAPHPIKIANATYEVYKDSIVKFEYDTDILPGIRAHATNGHTVGHTCYTIEAGEGWELAITGDLVHAYPLLFRYPENPNAWDNETVQMAASRRSFLDKLSKTNTIFTGCHVQQIGLVRARAAGGYELIPVPDRVSEVEKIEYK